MMDASALGGLSGKSVLTFRRLVHEFFESKGIVHAVGAQSVNVRDELASSAWGREFGLTNLAQSCAQTKQSAWKRLIADFFETVLAADAERQRFDRLAEDWDTISPHVAVRLYPDDMVGLADPAVPSDAQRVDFEGTITCLVIDMPNSVRSVTHEETARWNRNKAELFEVALAKVRQLSRPVIERIRVGDDECTLFEDQSFFTASYGLMLEQFPKCLGSHGSLVGIPNRHVALAYPIEDLRVIPVIQQLIPLIKRLYDRGPGSTSPFLYYRTPQGRFVNLPYELSGAKLAFVPPQSFIEILNALQP